MADSLEIPTCVTVPNSVILAETYEHNYGDLAENFDPSRPAFQGHLKVIGTDTDRSATCEFQLVFHSNYSPILFHFRDEGRYLPKN